MERKRILVIEDKEKHLQDARDYFSDKSIVDVTYAGTLVEAEQMMESKYDAVISDIFFPSGYPLGSERDNGLRSNLALLLTPYAHREKDKDGLKTWSEGQELAPLGVYAVIDALEKEIPAVFNTDADHHGALCEPVFKWATVGRLATGRLTVRGKRYVKVVDTGNLEELAEHKNWGQAYRTVVAGIENMRSEYTVGTWDWDDDEESLKKVQAICEKYGLKDL